MLFRGTDRTLCLAILLSIFRMETPRPPCTGWRLWYYLVRVGRSLFLIRRISTKKLAFPYDFDLPGVALQKPEVKSLWHQASNLSSHGKKHGLPYIFLSDSSSQQSPTIHVLLDSSSQEGLSY